MKQKITTGSSSNKDALNISLDVPTFLSPTTGLRVGVFSSRKEKYIEQLNQRLAMNQDFTLNLKSLVKAAHGVGQIHFISKDKWKLDGILEFYNNILVPMYALNAIPLSEEDHKTLRED